MSTIHDIKPNMSIDWVMFGLSLCLSFICLILIVIVIYFFKKYKNSSTDVIKQVTIVPKRAKTNIKDDYLKQVIKLKKFADKNPDDWQYIFFKISEIIRSFIEEYYEISALAKTKTELADNNIVELNKVLLHSYEIQFALGVASRQLTDEVINLVEIYIKNAI